MDDEIRKSLVSKTDDKSDLLLSTFAEIGIKTGDLAPLSDLLKSTFPLDRSIRDLLIKMISHSPDVDHVINIRKNPRLTGRTQTSHQYTQERWKKVDIAIWMIAEGIENSATYESAIEMASKEFNYGYKTVRNIWTEHKKEAKYLVKLMDEAEPLEAEHNSIP